MRPENPYLEALARVTAGRTASFAELARLAGRPAAARAAGRAVAALPTSDPRPWHRIVRSDGGLAPDPERALVQIQRLRKEGARPAVDESVDAWLRRRRARFVGLWTNRMLFDIGDPRLPRVDATRLEAIRAADQGFERGFYLAPPPRTREAEVPFEDVPPDPRAVPRTRAASGRAVARVSTDKGTRRPSASKSAAAAQRRTPKARA